MEDLKKIEFQSSVQSQPSPPSMKRKSFQFSFPKKTSAIILTIVLVFVIIGYFTIFLPAQKTYSSARKTYAQAKLALAAVKKQNITLASEELAKTKKELTQTQNDLENFSYVGYIPVLGGYYRDAEHGVKAGFEGIKAVEILIESVKPYADLLGLKGQGSFTGGSAEQRIQTAILTMGKITPRIDDVAESLSNLKKEVNEISPNHYPSFIAGGKVKNQLVSLQKTLDEAVILVEQARPLIKVLPSLLGETKEKKYLILFQNDKELRPTGGFMTAYAVFQVDKGIIHVDASSDIYNLDNTIRSKPKAPAPIKKYFPTVTQFHLRDTNLSPDFIESMKMFNELYEKATARKEVDGIVALDTHVLVSTIKILDDEVVAGGIKFNTQIDKRCDCPQVIYQLENTISTPKSLDLRVTKLADVQARRKDIIGVLLYAIMEKALKSSPKKYWGPLFQDIMEQIRQKHVLVYLYSEEAQTGIEAINAAGRINSFKGDYLHINQANFSGAKSNLFLKESVEQDYKIGNDGAITKKVTINYKNPYKASDCNLERGQVCLNALHKGWIRVYVPKGAKLVSSKGSDVKVTTYEELGKTVIDGLVTVRPQGAATYTLEYTLPFKAEKGALPLKIQKQPGIQNWEYTIKVNGKKKHQFELEADKEVKLEVQ